MVFAAGQRAFTHPKMSSVDISVSSCRYYSTIRSNSCGLLVKNPGDCIAKGLTEEAARDRYRCDECAKIREQILSMRG